MRKTDPIQLREMISLIAALLATITFTAGFTFPIEFNSDTGEAILAKEAAFVVFLLTYTYAMCCSMLVLFSILWSMVCNHNRASFLADRSLELLKHSLYGTLVAFMTGVKHFLYGTLVAFMTGVELLKHSLYGTLVAFMTGVELLKHSLYGTLVAFMTGVKHSLYGTLVAFMTGVCTVVHNLRLM